MPTQKLFKKKVLVLPSNTPAYEVARAMNEKAIGSILVSDGRGRILGIVTDRDIACGVVGERLSPDTPIIEVMATKPKYVDESAKLTKVLQLMQRYGIRRVPVISESKSGAQKCVGIYTLDDLIMSGEFSLKELKPVIRKQIRRTMPRGPRSERRTLRKEHTLNRFYKNMAESMALDPETAERAATYLLKSIVQRVPPHLAANLIAEIPSLLQEDLLNTKAGPNRANSMQFLLNGLTARFGIAPQKGRDVLYGFWRGLEKNLAQGILDHVLTSLPLDLKKCFSTKAEPPPLIAFPGTTRTMRAEQ